MPNLFSLKSCVKGESLIFFKKVIIRFGEFDFECCKSNIIADQVMKLFVL